LNNELFRLKLLRHYPKIVPWRNKASRWTGYILRLFLLPICFAICANFMDVVFHPPATYARRQISSEILLFLLFHFPDFIIVEGNDFPAVEHAYEHTVVVVCDHRQTVDVLFREFLEHGIQIVGWRGDDDV